MEWVIVDDADRLSHKAASLLLGAIGRDRETVLGLPTGRTPEGMYRKLVERCGREYHCFRDVTTFNLDEYVGIAPSHPGSYRSYMRKHLFDHVDVAAGRIHLPDGTAERIREENPRLTFEDALHEECRAYEAAIKAAGGLGLTFLGLGRNGHIGFNEPGASFSSRTRVVELALSTRHANAPLMPDGNVPQRAITMGIGTILESRSIVLMASGAAKADAVSRLSRATPFEDFPASALSLHPDVTVLIDRDAAASVEVDRLQ